MEREKSNPEFSFIFLVIPHIYNENMNRKPYKKHNYHIERIRGTAILPMARILLPTR